MLNVTELLILIMTLVFQKIYVSDAFIIPCMASNSTVRRVSMCPSNITAYIEAAKKKNCSSLSPDAERCHSFQYHCVLSDDLKYAVEVCAPPIVIIGSVCTKFSTRFSAIKRIDDQNCADCPYAYNSTLAFQYTECYENISSKLTQSNHDSVSTSFASAIAFGSAGSFIMIGFMILGILYYLKRTRIEENGDKQVTGDVDDAMPLVCALPVKENSSNGSNSDVLVSTTARRPTDKELVLVSKHIGAGYQLLGAYLGVKNTQMEQIRINHSSCIQTQIFKMLVLWRNHNDNQAHIGNLLFAIRETCSDVNILEIEQIFHL